MKNKGGCSEGHSLKQTMSDSNDAAFKSSGR